MTWWEMNATFYYYAKVKNPDQVNAAKAPSPDEFIAVMNRIQGAP